MEQPTTEKDTVETRLQNEMMWDAGTEVSATIVVVGWQPDGSGPLWEPGSDVTVKSPMAMLDQALSIQSATYTQDSSSGSLTTLVCVSENALNGPKRKYYAG
jgi:prophage tail gpP-like protein